MNDSIRVLLSARQLDWLADHKALPLDLMRCIEGAAAQKESGYIVVPLDVAESIADALTQLLGEIGFDEANQLTDEGQMIENLIDLFIPLT